MKNSEKEISGRRQQWEVMKTQSGVNMQFLNETKRADDFQQCPGKFGPICWLSSDFWVNCLFKRADVSSCCSGLKWKLHVWPTETNINSLVYSNCQWPLPSSHREQSCRQHFQRPLGPSRSLQDPSGPCRTWRKVKKEDRWTQLGKTSFPAPIKELTTQLTTNHKLFRPPPKQTRK